MTDSSSSNPWERKPDEPARWFLWFERYRLAGPTRSLLAVYRTVWLERVTKSQSESDAPSEIVPPRDTSGRWRKMAERWAWKERAEAWDQHLIDQAAAEAEARWKAQIMSPSEVLARLSEHGRNDMGQFMKASQRWTDEPLPSEEILEEEDYEVEVKGKTVTRRHYLVRRLVLDVDKLVDPAYSFRVKKFSDSPKNGLSVELYDADNASALVGRHHKLFVDRHEVTGEDGQPIPINDEQHNRALSTLADALGALLSGSGPDGDDELDAAE